MSIFKITIFQDIFEVYIAETMHSWKQNDLCDGFMSISQQLF